MASRLISNRAVVWALSIIGALVLASPMALAQTDTILHGNHPALAEGVTASGYVEPSRPLTMSVTLALRNQAQLEQLLADQQNPASPEYHRWLTREEFAARFGPTAFDAVSDWLVGQGFRVVAVNVPARVIQFTATAAQAEHAFSVALKSAGGQSYANTSDPHIPAELAGVIAQIHGLDNMSASAPGLSMGRLKPVPAPSSHGAPADASSAPGVDVQGNGPFFGPSDFYSFYNETPLLSSGLTGTSCIAIVGNSKFLPSAVSRFSKEFGLKGAKITTVRADPGNAGFNSSEPEAELDLEWAHAVAPGAALRFYLGNNSNFALDPITDAIAAAVNDPRRCPVISNSFGFCGASDVFYTGTLHPLFQQAAAQGQSVINITHDYGAAYLKFDSLQGCVAGTNRAVSEISADPNVTALGGTSFDPNFDSSGHNIGHVAERVWNDPNDGIPSGGATGGGRSAIFAKPAYQTGPGVPDDEARFVPDVSLIASPNFPGSWVVVDSSCFNPSGCTGKGGLSFAVFGGTSLSAPAFAGAANLIGQAVGDKLGNMNPTIYTLANNDLAGSGFRDVTVGNNAFNGVTGFAAGSDYDLCTGWGTVDIATFLTAYSKTLPGPAVVTLSPATLKFKNVRVGSTSKPKFVTIKVPRGQQGWTQIASVDGAGAFMAAQTCVGQWVGPGKTCKFGVTFSPTEAGPVGPLTLSVTDSAGNSPQTTSLVGTGK